MSFRKLLTLLIVNLSITAIPSGAMADQDGLTLLETDTPLKAVYHMADEDTDRIRIQAVFLVGEADLTGPEGLSHYLEHLVYLSADKSIKFGYHGRSGNAWVNGVITTYYNEGARSELNGMFAFVRNLLKPLKLSERFMLEERDVVMREYDLRVAENPDWKMWDEARTLLYGGNGAGRSVIGTRQSINELTIEAGAQFHKRCYHPANIVLIVTGNLSRDSARRTIERQFGQLKAGERCEQSWRDAFPRKPLEITEIQYSDRYVSRDAMKLSSLAQWTSGKGKLHDYYTLIMLRELLASTLEGGLAKPLRIDAFVLSGYDVWLQNPLNASVEFWFEGAPDEGVTSEEAIRATKEAVRMIADAGIPDKSIERIRKRLLRAAKRKADDANYHLGRANQLLSIGLIPNSNSDHVSGLEAVEKSDLDSAMAAIAGFERLIEVTLVPEISQ